MLNEPEELGEAPLELVVNFLAEAKETPIGAGGSGDLQELTVEDAFDGRVFTDGRKNAVAGLAWALSIRGAEFDEVLATCERFAEECCVPALELDVVRRKVDYTWSRIEKVKAEQAEREAREMAHVKLWTSGRR